METDHGYEREGWRAINVALGLTAIRIPEAYGGYGLSFGDQCIVLEEMGRASRRVHSPDRFPSVAALPSSANGLRANGAGWSGTLPARWKN